MQSIDTSGLERFDKVLDRLLMDMPKERETLHREIGDILKADVDAAMISAGLKSRKGKIRSWQKTHIGSRGGYAAVRPQEGALPANSCGEEYAFGHITNSIVSGHDIRKPESSSKHVYKKGRIKVGRVRGFPFYKIARTTADAKVIHLIEKYVDSVADRLEGKA